MQNLSRLAMVGCFALALGACDDGGSDDAGAGGATGGAGASGAGAAGATGSDAGTQVTWTDMGWIGDNPFDISGSWYSYDDCADAAGLPCTMRDASMTGPDMKTGWQVVGEGAASKVCAKGTATAVQDATTYGKQWGFGIAFDLNSPGGGIAKAAYNATTHNIKGFSFTLEGAAPAKIRINLPMTDPDNATFFREVSVPSSGTSNQVIFNDSLNFKQGEWVMRDTPTLYKMTYDPTTIYGVQFHVFTALTTPKPFDFCVSNFRVIQ